MTASRERGGLDGSGRSSLWRLSAYTISTPHMNPSEAAVSVKAAGYDGIEWAVHENRSGGSRQPTRLHRNDKGFILPTPEALSEARRISDDADLPISGLGMTGTLCTPARVGEALRLAEIAGTSQLRLHGGSTLEGQTYAEAYEETVRICEAWSKVAKGTGVKGVLHQHWGTAIASAGQVYRVVSQFDPELIGCIYDPGNMAVEGYDDYRLGVELLGPYVAHVHLKNVRYGHAVMGGAWHSEWAPLDDGQVDLHRLFGALRDNGYAGWIVMSDVGESRDDAEMLRYNNGFLRQIMADVEAEAAQPVGAGRAARPT
jgi:sugar phosphate isomerase/epimerase